MIADLCSGLEVVLYIPDGCYAQCSCACFAKMFVIICCDEVHVS